MRRGLNQLIDKAEVQAQPTTSRQRDSFYYLMWGSLMLAVMFGDSVEKVPVVEVGRRTEEGCCLFPTQPGASREPRKAHHTRNQADLARCHRFVQVRHQSRRGFSSRIHISSSIYRMPLKERYN